MATVLRAPLLSRGRLSVLAHDLAPLRILSLTDIPPAEMLIPYACNSDPRTLYYWQP
jgi:hypothetical protein